MKKQRKDERMTEEGKTTAGQNEAFERMKDEKREQWSTKRSSHLDLLCYPPMA
jgi:hypothetical protein